MERFEQLHFEADASWLWLPWMAALVLGVGLLGTGKRHPGTGPFWRRALAVGIGLLIVVYTVRTRSIIGYVACLGLILSHFGWWLAGSYRAAWKDQPWVGAVGSVLRILAIGVAAFLILRPVWVSREVEFRRPILAVALDESRSMETDDVNSVDGREGISRLAAVRQMLEQHADALAELDRIYRVQRYRFAERVWEEQSEMSEVQKGFTAIGDALVGIADEWSGPRDRLGGVLIISDGRNNLAVRHKPKAAARELSARGIPLWAVGVGWEDANEQTESLLGRSLRFSRRVSRVTRLPVDAEFEAIGLAGKTVKIELYLEDRLVGSKSERITSSPAVVEARFDISAPAEGVYALRVRASATDSEAEDSMVDYLLVEEGKIQVLFLDRPRVENGHIFRALVSSEELVIDRRFVRGTSRQALGALLRNRPIEWSRYHVVILGDVDLSGPWSGNDKHIRKRVRDGGLGLLVLGGRLSLGRRKAPPVALREVLPTDMDAIRQETTAIRVTPTPAGRAHGVCVVSDDPESEAAIWTELAEVEGTYTFANRKPAAESLLNTTEGDAVLIAHQAGQGRVAMLGLDQTWVWPIRSAVGGQVHRRFWRQLVIWLANRQPEVQVVTNRPRYDLGKLKAGEREVEILAFVRGIGTGSGGEVPAPEVFVVGPSGSKSGISLVAELDKFVGKYRPTETGEYELTASVVIDGKAIASEPARFLVERRDLEISDRRPDLDLLRGMAAETQSAGGAYADLREFASLLEEIRQAGRPERIERKTSQSLVGQWKWWVFGILLGLVTVEWGLRKRAGLI